MKLHIFIFFIVLTSLLLAACSPAKETKIYSIKQSTPTSCLSPDPNGVETCLETNPTVPSPISTPMLVPTLSSTLAQTQKKQDTSDASLTDNQGAVIVDIKPLNLDQPGDTLLFDVSMNTHSVDLSMDLVQLSTLTTDAGITVSANKWEGPTGGHHVEGQLSFPDTLDGKKLLDGANSITITIKDVDAVVRTFTWQLPG
jgi:hypothetical protein